MTPEAIKFVAVIYKLSLTVAVIYKLYLTVAVIYKLSLTVAVINKLSFTVAVIYKPSYTCRHLHADHSGTLFDPQNGLEGYLCPGINIFGNIDNIDTPFCTSD